MLGELEVTTMDEKIKIHCEIEVTFKMIGGKCKPLILYTLITSGTKRFNELKKIVHQISQKTLTNQLKELEADGLIERKCFAEVPLRVEYSATEKGKSLISVFNTMYDWGKNNIDDRFEMQGIQL